MSAVARSRLRRARAMIIDTFQLFVVELKSGTGEVVQKRESVPGLGSVTRAARKRLTRYVAPLSHSAVSLQTPSWTLPNSRLLARSLRKAEQLWP